MYPLHRVHQGKLQKIIGHIQARRVSGSQKMILKYYFCITDTRNLKPFAIIGYGSGVI